MIILATSYAIPYPPFILPRWLLFLVVTSLFLYHMYRIHVLYKERKVRALTSMLKLVSVYFFLGYLILYTAMHAINRGDFHSYYMGAYFLLYLFSWHYSYPLFFTLIYAAIAQAFTVHSISRLEQESEQECGNIS